MLSHIKQKVDDTNTRMETSHRKFLCQLAAQSGRPKSSVHKAAKLLELQWDNATDCTGNFSVTS
jgi:hypothetical protein